MFRRFQIRRFFFAAFRAALLTFFATGCSHLHFPFHKKTKPSAVQSPAGPRLIGTVAVVNENLHFVLVDAGWLYAPVTGTALKSFSAGQETAVLTVSPESRQPFISADIVHGTPHQGDLVFE